jgi:hypothetical protein
LQDGHACGYDYDTMTRSEIEARVSEVVHASRKWELRVEASIGEPLSDADNAFVADLLVPKDYSEFLRLANGLKIYFFLPQSTNGVPIYTFELVGVPQIVEATVHFRTYIESALESEKSFSPVTDEYRSFVDSLLSFAPRTPALIHKETAEIFLFDDEYASFDGQIRKIADSFEEFVYRSFDATMQSRGDPPGVFW